MLQSWDTLNNLFQDMISFSKDHPNWLLIPADEGGMFGWVAYDPDNDDDYKNWYIKVSYCKNCPTHLFNIRPKQNQTLADFVQCAAPSIIR